MNIKIPSISEFFSRRKAIENHKQEVSKIFGNSRSASRFKNNDNHIFLKDNGWVLSSFATRPGNTCDYIFYRQADVDNASEFESIPVIEFNCDDYTLKFNSWGHGTIVENIPTELNAMITNFQDQFKTTLVEVTPVKYQKLYIAVLDEVNDGMVPTLVAHNILGAHLEWVRSHLSDPSIYDQWLHESFRKCVVKVNRKEFEKIKQLDKVYLGHENTTLGGEKSCAVVYPVWSNDLPNVLKFAKLWKPTNNTIIYFDMDGVLADFDLAYRQVMGVPVSEFSKLPCAKKDKIKEDIFSYDYFRNMKPIQKGLELLKFYQDHYETVVILSATSDTSHKEEVERAKREWLQQHVGDIPAYFSERAEFKYQAMKLFPSFTSHVLIDDRLKSLEPWIENGGVGILFRE